MAGGWSPTRGYAAAVVRLRWLVLVGVAGVTYAAVSFLPSLNSAGGGLTNLVNSDAPAVLAQEHALARFGLPLLARTVVVQHDPAGLSPSTVVRSVQAAASVDVRAVTGSGGDGGVRGALPVPNALPVPGIGQPTTVVTYLFTDPSGGLSGQVRAAQGYAAGLGAAGGPAAGVTGTVPIQAEQADLIARRLEWVEIGSVAAVALIVGLNFRSVVAPAITLLTAGVAYLVTLRVIGEGAALLGLTAPTELEPVVVALTLGITTDYSIFFLSALRLRLGAGERGRGATRSAVAEYLPIILTAGFTIAASVATLAVARLPLFRAFGPGLAITVVVGLAVAVTLVPALLAVLGRWALWPTHRPEPSGSQASGPAPARLAQSGFRGRLARLLTRRRIAAPVAGTAIALLLAATSPLLGLHGSISPASTLPSDDPVRLAADAAAAGFAPGVLSPTEVLLEQPGVTGNRAALAELQRRLEAQPDVAGVVGPLEQPFPPLPVGLFLAPGGDAARYLVVFDHDALGAPAIQDLRDLQGRMPGLLAGAGLDGAQVEYAGDTAVGLSLVDTTRSDLRRVSIVIALVDLVLLMVFLRAVVAPLYLLVCSFLSVGAALGLTTWVFQGFGGYGGLVFYAPFAAAVLLVSLGSDYNIFSVGYIWDEARHKPLREALVAALPRSTRPVNAAGLALATSFAFVALIPVAPFRELAVAMALGVLIDTFLVRSFLVPSLIVLVGRVSGWPGRRLANT